MVLKSRLVIFLLAVFMLAATGLSTRAQASAFPAAPDGPVVVRVYYGARENLDLLAKTLDIWEVNHAQAYLVALVSADRYTQLDQAGYRLEIDVVKTAELNQPREALPGQGVDGIPSYPCYRTVEETDTAMDVLAANNPSLATVIDIGDSWDKLTPTGPVGYDLFVLDLTNKLTPEPKPTFFLMAEIHAREYVTAETAMRFAEYLVSQYGVDPDITWLLDYYHVYVMPMTNPDGRKFAEAGNSWRKNTDSDDGCTYASDWGTDLNRNHSFKWNTGGSVDDPCGETYHGPSAASEPEVYTIQDFVMGIFADQRGPGDTDPAPADTTGVLITLHSYSQLVLWPWGWTGTDAPNHSQLRTLGRKLAYFNSYTPQQANDLYATSGTTDDWAYGELGIAAYTFEMGTTFFQSCSTFESTIYPSNLNALLYAFKAARQPYMDPSGPESLSVTVNLASVAPGTPVALDAVANDTRYRSGTGEPTQNIAAARYTIDDPSWITATVAYAMTADDGSFNEKIEDVSATVDTTCLAPGEHMLFVESEDANHNWGVPGAAFLTVGEAHAVSLSPSAASQNASHGQMVAYPLTVANLGNTNDTFTVTIDSNWVTTAPLEITNLAGCGQVVMTVTVAVPGAAVVGMSDVATVTVTSQADDGQTAVAQLTTQVVGAPLQVAPLSATQAGDPGQAVVYSLSVTNTNEISMTFDLIVNSAWEVEAPAAIGPLDPFANTSLVVTVTVPENAAAGALDVTSLLFASQTPGVLPVTATLTTTANGVYGMVLAAPVIQQIGLPGEWVTYTLYLTNTGNLTDTFDTVVTNIWDVIYTPTIGPLGPGQSAVVEIRVFVPTSLALGSSDTANVVITSQGETGLWRSFDLISSAYRRVYLAIVNK